VTSACEQLVVAIEKIFAIDNHVGCATAARGGRARPRDRARVEAQTNRITYDEPSR